MTAASKRFPERSDLRLEGETVLRRHDSQAPHTVEWIHDFLTALGSTGFRAPVPVPYFDGRSVAVVRGEVWSALSYVPGEIVGWSQRPNMSELGAFLATFHLAAASVAVPTQQVPCFPVDALPGVAGGMERVGHARRTRHVIHGDFTNHNVLVDDSRSPSGAIDFMNAYVEVPLFDVGAALWRSGRPAQEAHEFDLHRLRDYVDGYASVLPLSGDDRAAVLVYLEARGEQILFKQATRGIDDARPRQRLEWLRTHRDRLVSALIP